MLQLAEKDIFAVDPLCLDISQLMSIEISKDLGTVEAVKEGDCLIITLKECVTNHIVLAS